MKNQSFLHLKMLLHIFVFLITIFSFPSLSHADLNDGLVAYYPFNANANDESTNTNNGTVNGATLTTDRFGNTDSAYYFNGLNSDITIPNHSSINITNTRTVTVWINKFGTAYDGNNYSVIAKYRGDTDNESGWQLSAYQNASDETYALVNYKDGLGGGAAKSNGPIAFNEWYFLSIVIDAENNQISLYVNRSEVSVSNSTINLIDNQLDILIGACYGSSGAISGQSRFYGVIDDIRIYDRVLTESEILELYNENDQDHDLIPDDQDNCPETYNPDQLDSDSDNMGNICDSDYTVLLIHSDNSDGSTEFIDSSVFHHIITVNGDTYHETDQAMVGDSSIYFDGDGDNLEVSDNAFWAFEDDDFTMEAWIWIPSGITWSQNGILGQNTADDTACNILELFSSPNGSVRWLIRENSISVVDLISNNALSTETWHHIAAVRNGNSFTLYVDGTAAATTVYSGSILIDEPMKIGVKNDGTVEYFNGFIDEIRISKGIARWIQNFIPLTQPYTHPQKYITALIDHTKVDDDLTDFPVLVHLSADCGLGSFDASDLFGQLPSYDDRKKIAIFDPNGNQCYVEIESWDVSNKEAWLWVKVPISSGTEDTELKIYYDQTMPGNTEYVGDTGDIPAQNVWDNNFVGVWHMAQDPSNGTNSILDSTSNLHHGTPAGGMDGNNLVDSIAGKAINFDGTSNYISLDGWYSLTNFSSGTVEALFNTDTDYTTGGHYILSASDGADTRTYVAIAGNKSFDSIGNIGQSADTVIAAGADYYNALNWNGATVSAYLNNSIFIDNLGYTVGTSDGTKLLKFGSYSYPAGQYFQGRVSEIRISQSERSETWLKATYHSNLDDLITYSSVFDTTPPAEIDTLTVTPQTNGTSALLDWIGYDEGLGGTTYYRIYVSTSEIIDLPETSDYTISAGQFIYLVTGLDRDETYYFAVVPVDGSGNAVSKVTTPQVTTTTIDTEPPESVTNLQLESCDTTSLNFTWDHSLDTVGDLAGYRVEVSGKSFVEYQLIPTTAAGVWESFEIAGDTYLAVTNYRNETTFAINSHIYKWNGDTFTDFQSIPTNGATNWESFEIAGETYLALTNIIDDIPSRIYKWDGNSFVEIQSIPITNATDCESFEISGEMYLAIAKHYTDTSPRIYDTNSYIYKWNGTSFVEIQSIPTSAAYDWESFKIAGETYLAVANYYNGTSTNINSRIFKWVGDSFIEIQSIPTNGAVDWESFEISGEMYLAVANMQDDGNFYINSRIYRWMGDSFSEIQAIPTIGAVRWRSFQIAGEMYLAVGNNWDGSTRSLDSHIYKWTGDSFSEIQTIPTIGGGDWESFEISGEIYLAVTNCCSVTSWEANSVIYKWQNDILTQTDLPTTQSNYQMTDLVPSTQYDFKITAFDGSGNESFGEYYSAATVLNNPENLSAVSGDGSIDLTWDSAVPLDIVQEYSIYVSETDFTDVDGMTPVDTATALSTSATITGLENATTYYLAVTAINISGCEEKTVETITAVPMSERYDDHVVLMIHSDDADGSFDFFDSSDSNHSISGIGDVHHTTSQKVFDNSSIFFDGDGDYLEIPDSDDWGFGTGDFTIDFWIYLNSLSNETIFSDSTHSNRFAIVANNDTTWSIRTSSSASNPPASYNIYTFSDTISINVWYHVSVTRKDGQLRFFRDGVQKGNTETDSTDLNIQAVKIGSWYWGADYFNGYLDEIRISKGIARWTENFTPPSRSYGDEAKYITATIDHTKVDATLTDFPVLIHLSNESGINTFDASGLFNELYSYDDRKKIAIRTKDGNQCYTEIESWDSVNQEAWLWVKVPYIGSTEDTELKIFYDKDMADQDQWSISEASDDFTGVDDELPDPKLWKANSTYDQPTIKSNKLNFLNTTSSKSVLSTYKIMGDFDIQIDWDISTGPSTDQWWFDFIVTDDATSGNDIFYIERSYTGGHRLSMGKYESGSCTLINSINNTAVSGKWRIERVGDVFTGYYWSEGAWVEFGSSTVSTLSGDSCEILLAAYSTMGTTSDINFDNLKVNEADKIIGGYVGDTGETPAQNVWDDNYAGVWHMAQNPSIGTNSILDSTSNVHHGTPMGSMDGSNLVDSLAGKAINFDGTSDYISLDGWYSLTNFSSGTVEVLFNTDTTYTSDVYYILSGSDGTDTRTYIDINSGNIRGVLGNVGQDGGTIVSETDYYNSLIWNGTTFSASLNNLNYIDNLSYSVGTSNSTKYLKFGTYATPGNYFQGNISEVRISQIERSESWLKATYHSTFDDLITYGSDFDITPPTEVNTLSVTPQSDTSVLLTWNGYDEAAQGGVAYYRIYYSENACLNDISQLTLVDTVDGGIFSYTVNNLNIGSTFCFSVVAVDSSGNALSSVSSPTAFSVIPDNTYIIATIDHTKVDEDLTNFPVLLHLSDSSGIGDVNASALFDELTTYEDRKKIAVVDANGNRCFVEIESWDDTAKEAWLWVRVPYVSSNEDTELRIFYDNEMAENELWEALKASDDFTGSDSSLPNEKLWRKNPVYPLGVIKDNKYYANIPGTGSSTSATKHVADSIFRIRGDFDIQIDFSDLSGPSSNWWDSSLVVVLDDVNKVFIGRRYISQQEYYGIVRLSGSEATVVSASSDTSGKLRIVRSGADITTYFWNGTDWTTLNINENWILDDVYVQLNPGAVDSVGLEVYFDNFKINYADEIFVGYVGDTGQPAAHNVWDENYIAVWHMAQDPSEGSESILDSTNNGNYTGNHATPEGSMTSDDVILGSVGMAIEFDGLDDGLQAKYNVLGNDSDAFTVEVVFLPKDNSGFQSLISRYQGVAPSGYYDWMLWYNSDNYEKVSFFITASQIGGSGTSNLYSNDVLSLNNWYYATGVKESGSGAAQLLYVDGVLNASGDAQVGDTHSYPILIGKHPSTTPIFYNGSISEIRLSNIPRSASWIKATHSSNFDDLITYSFSVDITSPAPVDTLTITEEGDGSSATLDWTGYDETAQGDVAYYKIYVESTEFNDLSKLTPVDTVSNGTFTYTVDALTPGDTYYTAVVAVDYSGNEQSSVSDPVILNDYSNQTYISVTIDHTKIDEDLTDFPIMLYLSQLCGTGSFDASILFEKLPAYDDRKKIAVYDQEGNQCYAEIETWDAAAKEIWLWVKVPHISATEDTVLNLLFNTTTADNTDYVGDIGDAPAQQVWDSHFISIWHLSQDPDGDLANSILDSTANGYHGSPQGSMTSDHLTDGMIGRAIEFDGLDDGILGLPSMPQTSTLEYWTNTATSGKAMQQEFWNNGSNFFSFLPGVSSEGNLEYWAYSLSDGVQNDFSIIESSVNYQDSLWHNIAVSFDTGTGDAYLDGQFLGSDTYGFTAWDAAVNSAITIGATREFNFDTGAFNYFSGIVDEVRISDIVRSPAWLSATYYSNFDNLVAYNEMIDTTPPDSVDTLEVNGAGNCTQAVLTWTHADWKAEGVKYYKIYASTDIFNDVDLDEVPLKGTLPAGQFTYTVGGLDCNETYYFAVVPVDHFGNMETMVVSPVETQITDIVPPEDVTNLQVGCNDTGLSFTWTHSADTYNDLANYIVYFDNSTTVEVLDKTTNSWDSPALSPGTEYDFRVVAIDTRDNPSAGAAINGVTLFNNPTNVNATPDYGRINLTWDPVASNGNLQHYAVYKSTDTISNITDTLELVATPTEPTAKINVDENDQTYHFAVTTVNTIGCEQKTGFSTASAMPLAVTFVSSTITQDTTWSSTGNPYIIRDDVIVRQADQSSPIPTLTIEPGVVVRFDSETGLNIGDGTNLGVLSAQGDTSSKIIFTSDNTPAVPGSWDGVTISGTKWSSNLCTGGTCEESDYYSDQSCSGAFGEGYYRSNNTSSIHWIGYDFGEGNEHMVQRIRIQQDGVYYAGSLIIEGSNSLDANWAEKDWTTLTTVNDGHTGWNTIDFYNNTLYRFVRVKTTGGYSSSFIIFYKIEMYEREVTATTTLDNCIIEYGGQSIDGQGGNITIKNANPIITNCTIQDSSNHGIYLEGTSYPNIGDQENGNVIQNNGSYGIYSNDATPFPVIIYNTLSGNGIYPIRISAMMRVSDNTFPEGENQAIEVISEPVYLDTTWSDNNVPFIISEDIPVRKGSEYCETEPTLTIEPGTDIRFESESGLYIGDDTRFGSLSAQGVENDPITFTANAPSSSEWKGITINESDQWSLNLCTGGTCEESDYYSDRSCSGAFGEGYYRSNDSSSVHWIGYDFGEGNEHIVQRIRIQQDGVYYAGSLIVEGSNSLDANWAEKDWTTLTTVNDGHTGWNTIDFYNNTLYRFVRVKTTGGYSSSFIIFYKIEMYEREVTATTTLDNCIIEYGGQSIDGQSANINIKNASPIIINCTIKDSINHGIYLEGGSYPEIGRVDNSNTINNNATYGLYCFDAIPFPYISYNTFSNNGVYPIRIGAVMNISNNSYVENGIQSIEVLPELIFADITWNNETIPYVITGDINVYQPNLDSSEKATLRIDPGVMVRFELETGINIGNSSRYGTLVAQGTEMSNITFTSNIDPPSQGDWKGITINKMDQWGENLCTEGTCEESDYYSDQSCLGAFGGAYYRSNSTSSIHWIGYDFGEGNEHKVQRISIKQDSVYYASSLTIEGSNSLESNWEEKEWIALKTVNDGHDGWNDIDFYNNTPYRFVRVKTTGGYSNGFIIFYVIEMYERDDSPSTYIENCIIEYGGYHESGGIGANIILNESNPIIRSNNIRTSGHSGILINGSGCIAATLECNNLKDNYYGMYVTGNAEPTIFNNNFIGNQDYGVSTDNNQYHVVNAVNNWWGDINGPNKSGDAVGGNVNFTPWRVTVSDCISAPPTNTPPFVPRNPVPSNNAVRVPAYQDDQPIDVDISWLGGDPNPWDTVVYDVHLGTNSTNLPLLDNGDNIADSTLSVSGLAKGTTYYWQVIAYDNAGGSTEGPIWVFTTEGESPDLEVTSLTWTPTADIEAGQEVTFSAVVQNNGSGPVVDNFQITLNLDGATISTQTISQILHSGISAVVTGTWTAQPGAHNITATVDIGDLVDEADEGNNTRTESIPTVVNTPPVQVNLSVTCHSDGTSAELNWGGYDESGLVNVDHYNIYYRESTTPLTSVDQLTANDTVDAGTFSYPVVGLSKGIEYHFAVVAFDIWGDAILSVTPAFCTTQDTIPPEDPTNLRTECTENGLIFRWDHADDPYNDLSGYVIDFNNGSVTTTLDKSVDFYEASNLDPGMAYDFKITSVDDANLQGNELEITGITTFDNPTNINATPDYGRINLTWDSVVTNENFQHYAVYMTTDDTAGINDMQQVATPTEPSAAVNVFQNDTTYYFAVISVNTNDCDAKTNFSTASAIPLSVTYVNGVITESTTWTLDNSPYVVTGDVYVNHSNRPVLKIEAGVVVRFENDTGLYIGYSHYGSLEAQGTADSKIIFTSNQVDPHAGDWKSIGFWLSAQSSSYLEHSVITYGGDIDGGNIVCYNSSPSIRNSVIQNSISNGIRIEEASSAEVTNNLIQQNREYGIYVINSSPLIENNNIYENENDGIFCNYNSAASITANDFQNNVGYPIVVYAHQVEPVTGNTGSGNGEDGIEILAYPITVSSIWTKQPLPYIVNSDVYVNSSDHPVLTIDSGVTVKFKEGAGLYVGYSNNGSLKAQGEVGSTITFTSNKAEPMTGDWDGIYFGQVQQSQSYIENCIIEYGGETNGANVYIYNTKPTIQFNTIRNSSDAGVHVDGTASTGAVINCNNFKDNVIGINITNNALPTVSGNNFLRNQDYGIYNSGATVEAINNWWGDILGPNDDEVGDDVDGNVNYTPWLTVESTCIASPPTNTPPFTPKNPVPADGAIKVPVYQDDVPIDLDLSWAGGDPNPWDEVEYDVYLGTDPNNLPLLDIGDDISGSTLSVSGLQKGTVYYWQVISYDDAGGSTDGPVWTFTTLGDPADLIISDISWSPDVDIEPGEVVTFTATIENIGAGPVVDSFQAGLYLDGAEISTRTVTPVIPVGGSVQVTGTWTAQPGDHTIEVTADINDTVDETDNGNNSSTQSLPTIVNTPPPQVALNVICAGSGDSASLSWSGYDESGLVNVDFYRIYYTDTGSFDSVDSMDEVDTVENGNFSYHITGLSAGTEYHFAVVAVDIWGDALPDVTSVACTPMDIVAPEDISNLSVTCYATSLRFEWDASPDTGGDLTGYNIYIDGQGPEFVDASQLYYDAINLEEATQYTITVKAYDGQNESSGLSFSGITLLPNPEGLTVTAYSGFADLTWYPVTPTQHVKNYAVYHSDAFFDNVDDMTPVNVIGTTARISGLTNGTMYYFAVTTVNLSNGEDTDVTTVTATPVLDDAGPVMSDLKVNGVALADGHVLLKDGVFSLNATDGSGVDRVVFYLDGGLVNTDQLPLYTYALDISGENDGEHTIRIEAYDIIDNMTEQEFDIIISNPPPFDCYDDCID